MSSISSELLTRFAALPRMAGETWQGGLLRMPAWIEKGPDGKPYRPWAGFWVSLRTGLVHMKMEPECGAHEPSLALEALLEFGLSKKVGGCRPTRLEVPDEELGVYLVRALGDEQLTFTVSEDLRAVRQLLAQFGEHMGRVPLPPGALDAPGVTVERMRAFATAAKSFYLAALWRYLTDEDLIYVEAPAAESGLRHFTVLGAAGQVFGLGFFDDLEDFEAVHAERDPRAYAEGRDRWAVWYLPIQDVPFGDVDLWEDHGLPVAADQAYPVALQFGPKAKVVRPDAKVLAYLEGLVLALGKTSEREIDQGRWTHQVQTHEGLREFTFSIPALLEPLDAPPAPGKSGMPDRRIMERVLTEMERFMARSGLHDLDEANKAIQSRFSGRIDDIPSTAETPLEKAQELVYRAFDAPGRRRTQLARSALELSADCADAYVVLAEQASDPETVRNLYTQGVAAGERALGPRMFEEQAGHFWGMVQTRPYMRARFGLACCLEDLGQVDEAIEHYRELLRLNPNDNQGVRDVLLPALLLAGRDAEAGTLLSQYEDDPSAVWQYGWALWAFRRDGDSQPTRERLRGALRANRYVPRYLTGKAEWPGPLPGSYAFGSEEEAAICADELGEAWRATPGAEHWLNTMKPKKKSQRRRRR